MQFKFFACKFKSDRLYLGTVLPPTSHRSYLKLFQVLAASEVHKGKSCMKKKIVHGYSTHLSTFWKNDFGTGWWSTMAPLANVASQKNWTGGKICFTFSDKNIDDTWFCKDKANWKIALTSVCRFSNSYFHPRLGTRTALPDLKAIKSR